MDSNWKGVKATRKSIEKRELRCLILGKIILKINSLLIPKKKLKNNFNKMNIIWRLIVRFKIGNWDFNLIYTFRKSIAKCEK